MKIETIIFTKDCDAWRLKYCLACNLNQDRVPDKISIIDFGSSEENKNRYKEVITKSISPEKIELIEILEDTELFHPSRMANKAIALSTADVLCFTDVDAILGRNAYSAVEEMFNRDEKLFLMCSRLDLPPETDDENIDFTKDFQSLWLKHGGGANHVAPGSFQCFSAQWLRSVGGYDEFYRGWGLYDLDIRDRAEWDGCKLYWLEQTHGVQLMHIYHPPRPYKESTDHEKMLNYYHSGQRKVKIGGNFMKKILISGASGFIGSHVVEEALKRGLQPICFDRYLKNSYPEGCEVFQGDIRDFESINEAISKVDYAVNLAGILGTQETINDPIPSIQTNIIGAINFLTACKPTKFHQVRAVQIGVGNHWMNNSYSITKDTAVRFCMMFNHEHGTKVAMVRGLNAYGERQKHKPVRKIIPTFVVRALNNQDIEVYGDGSQIMDMIYVKDLANILIDACVKEHNLYDTVIDAGTGRETSVNWIAEQVIVAADSQSKIVHSPMRPGEPEKSVVRADRETLALLGEYNLVSFEEGIKKTVEWYRDNYDWKDGLLS